jgi:hypothetical protein
MGDSPDDPIQLINDLKGQKNQGDTINIPVVFADRTGGKRGTQTLSGSESQIINDGDRVTVEVVRNAWAVHEADQQKSSIDLAEQVEPLSTDWLSVTLRNDLLSAAGSPNLDGKTPYASTTESDKNAWLAANADRVLFGASVGNASSLVHATALATLDSTADIMSAAIGDLAAFMFADTEQTQAIRPWKVEDSDQEWRIFLLGNRAWRDLKKDTRVVDSYKYAASRGMSNRLFTGGEIILDGNVYRNIPEIRPIVGVGSGGVDVEPVYVMGGSALAVAWAQKPKEISEKRDFGIITGTGVQEKRGFKKIMYQQKQFGMLTLYVAAPANS